MQVAAHSFCSFYQPSILVCILTSRPLYIEVFSLHISYFIYSPNTPVRILQWGEDRRFDNMRGNLGKLAVFWIFQVSWLFSSSFFH